jgi:hypothetical protein
MPVGNRSDTIRPSGVASASRQHCIFENPRFRASSLSLITAAIVHWNTAYLDRAVRNLRDLGADVPYDILGHAAPSDGSASV